MPLARRVGEMVAFRAREIPPGLVNDSRALLASVGKLSAKPMSRIIQI